MAEPEFPYFLYLYDAQGQYGPPFAIRNNTQLDKAFSTMIRSAIMERREVRITNFHDEIVFHAKDGRVEWNGGGDIEELNRGIEQQRQKEN